MTLGSYLGKEERKDSAATKLDAGAQLSKGTLPRAGLGLFGRVKDSEF